MPWRIGFSCRFPSQVETSCDWFLADYWAQTLSPLYHNRMFSADLWDSWNIDSSRCSGARNIWTCCETSACGWQAICISNINLISMVGVIFNPGFVLLLLFAESTWIIWLNKMQWTESVCRIRQGGLIHFVRRIGRLCQQWPPNPVRSEPSTISASFF